MERLKLKNMSLKRSLFLITLLCLLAAVALAAAAWFVIDEICERYYPGGGLVVSMDGIIMDWNEVSPEQQRIHDILGNLQLMLCMALPLLGLAAAGIIFYRVKLKTPLALLLAGTERIQNHDLDFTLDYNSKDELGQLCRGFEVMRSELLKSNRELWQQAEDRRRLNAAFAHDLRNPITVVKGVVKLLKQENESRAVQQLETHISRIERYVEVMVGVQRLEDIPVRRRLVRGVSLRQNLAETAEALAAGCRVEVEADNLPPEVNIDSGLLAVVAENLIGNAVRFAAGQVSVALSADGDQFLVLTVADDGAGYPPQLLSDGAKPFGRVGEEPEHFGMGLYICHLICIKHGGRLDLRNAEKGGAVATAVFRLKE